MTGLRADQLRSPRNSSVASLPRTPISSAFVVEDSDSRDPSPLAFVDWSPYWPAVRFWLVAEAERHPFSDAVHLVRSLLAEAAIVQDQVSPAKP